MARQEELFFGYRLFSRGRHDYGITGREARRNDVMRVVLKREFSKMNMRLYGLTSSYQRDKGKLIA